MKNIIMQAKINNWKKNQKWKKNKWRNGKPIISKNIFQETDIQYSSLSLSYNEILLK